MELSSCIKPGVLSSLESIKNISEISQNPFSSFFQILQEQQEKKNFSKFPVLAEINSYAHPTQYPNYNQERQIFKLRKMTFTEDEDLYNNTFNLDQNTSNNLQELKIESNQNKFNFNVGATQQKETNQTDFFQDELLSQNFDCAISEYCNGYEEEDQENEEGGANTPGFTSQYQSPQSKCLITDTINKSNSYYTEQNPVSNEFFTRSQQLFEGSPVFSKYIHNNSNNQTAKQDHKINSLKQNLNSNPQNASNLFPTSSALNAKDKQKQQNIAYQSQVAYQKGFVGLEESYQKTLEQIQSYDYPTQSLKYNLKEQLLDSKVMALPQNYDQMIRYISSLKNLVNQVYQITLSLQEKQENQSNFAVLKRSMSTPSVQIRTQSIFSSINQPFNNLKKSTSIHLASLSNNNNNSDLQTTISSSQFKHENQQNKCQDQSSNYATQDNINPFNLFNLQDNSVNQNQNQQNQFVFNFSSNNQEQSNQLFNQNSSNILDSQQQQFFQTIQKSQSQQNETQSVNLFGLSVQKSSRSSSIRSSHFNEDNEIYNSPLSTSNNITNLANHIQNIQNANKQDDDSQVGYKNSFSNKFEFISSNFIEQGQECPQQQQEQKGITDFQMIQQIQQKNNKLEVQTKSPLIISDNEETALPTFKNFSVNPFFDYSHTPTIQSVKSSKNKKSHVMFID